MTDNPRPLHIVLGSQCRQYTEVCKRTPACPPVVQIGFTGSTAVGKEILAEAASTMKSTSLECGGKNPLIICADANIDEVCLLTSYQRIAMSLN